MGIEAKKGAWVYTSSGSKISFENWFKFVKSKKAKSGDCANASTGGKWNKGRCNGNHRFVHFICEFA